MQGKNHEFRQLLQKITRNLSIDCGGKHSEIDRSVVGQNHGFHRSFTVKNSQNVSIGSAKISQNSQDGVVVGVSHPFKKQSSLENGEIFWMGAHNILLGGISKFWSQIPPSRLAIQALFLFP